MRLMRVSILTGLALVITTTARPASADNAQEVARLEGTWRYTSLEIDGKPVGPVPAGSRIVIKGNTFTSATRDAVFKGTFTVDASQTPRTIDITFTDGPEAGTTALGIYELEQDRWKLCLTIGAKTRPRAFATAPGSGLALETLTRQKEAQAGDARRAAAQLEGEWTTVSGEQGGCPLPDEMVKSGRRSRTYFWISGVKDADAGVPRQQTLSRTNTLRQPADRPGRGGGPEGARGGGAGEQMFY